MAATAQGKVQLVADTKRFPRAPSAFRWVRAFGNWGITWSQWNLGQILCGGKLMKHCQEFGTGFFKASQDSRTSNIGLSKDSGKNSSRAVSWLRRLGGE